MSGDGVAMLRLDHVQIAIPVGAEAACRGFYVGVLGMTELVKPPELAKRGGIWVKSGAVEIHLGVDAEFRPARKAHPGIVVADDDAGVRISFSRVGVEPGADLSEGDGLLGEVAGRGEGRFSHGRRRSR